MATKRSKPYTHTHKDGSVWAKGQMTGDTMTGYWEWFRKDGTIMRSGSFDAAGQQTGAWTTYDQKGKVYKVTQMKPKPARKTKAKTKPKAKPKSKSKTKGATRRA